MNRKALALASSMLLIALLARPETAAALHWKTYRNENLGFEVNYPSYLTPETEKGSPPVVGFLERKFSGTGCYDFEVGVHPRGAMSREEAIQDSNLFWTKKQAESYYQSRPHTGPFPFSNVPPGSYFIGGSNMDPERHPLKEITISGYSGLSGKTWRRCYYDAGGIAGSGPVRVVFLLGKHHYAAINIMLEGSDTDKMLSTFRFIEP